MIRKMLLAAFALVALTAAPAAAQYDFTVTPTVVSAGGTVNVTGKGCAAGSPVTVTVTQRSTGEVVLTTTGTADGDGEFSIDIVLDDSFPPGLYDVEARCALPDCTTDASQRLQGVVEGCELVFAATVEIAAPGPGPTTPGDGVDDGDIVRTGSDLNGLGMLGAGLLAAGGLVLVATKGRRRTAEA